MPSQAGLDLLDKRAFLANLTPKSWDDVASLDLSTMPVFTNEAVYHKNKHKSLFYQWFKMAILLLYPRV